MNFQEAIIYAVDLFGREIVTEVRLGNIISDLNAYGDKPACKRILREVINSGVASKLKEQQSDLAEFYIPQAIQKLTRDNGFQEDLVEYVLYAILNALVPPEKRKHQKETLQYEYIGSKDEYGLRDVRLNGKWGFITSDDKEIVPPIYDYVGSFHEGMAEVANNSKYGFIDLNGNLTIDLKYDSVSSFRSGLSKVKLSGKYGLVNKSGDVILPFEYDDILHTSGGMIGVKKGSYWGFSTLSGEITVKPKYLEIIKNFSRGYAAVFDGYNKIIINTKGEIIQYLR